MYETRHNAVNSPTAYSAMAMISLRRVFRGFAPPNSFFWRIYGRGTYPNGPVFGGRLYKKMPGRYLFRLTPHGLSTRRFRRELDAPGPV